MNPYDPPNTEPSEAPAPPWVAEGRPCQACGSTRTGRDTLSHRKPNLLWVILFGWIFLLIRGAFTLRKDLCRDCGFVNRYKSAGSWLALAVLLLIVLLVILALLADPQIE